MSEHPKVYMEWVKKADHDLGSAKIIFSANPEFFDTIAFHCQQAVEKYIKAILVFFDISFERSHDLVYLLDLLSKKIEVDESVYSKAITLHSFSVEIRYPFSRIEITKEELILSLETAEFFRKFAIDLIENK